LTYLSDLVIFVYQKEVGDNEMKIKAIVEVHYSKIILEIMETAQSA